MDLSAVPAGVRHMLRRFQTAGYEAYLVGGCVRDTLIGRVPGDWDICTSALPDQTIALFDRTVPTGLRHGTVTVFYGGVQAEVTTFRVDGGYSDHRRPDEVRFTNRLEQDLSRRDFTINAMAVGLDGQVIDLFGGQQDLQQRVIRCVGDPDVRFQEDALRMFRAFRFAAQLGFSFTAYDAVRRNAHLARFVAPERICVEIEKTLLSPQPEFVQSMVRYGLLDAFLHRTDVPLVWDYAAAPPEKALRWTQFCATLRAAGAVDDIGAFLRGLRVDGHTARLCQKATEITADPFPADDPGLRRLIARYGPEAVRCAAACGDFRRDQSRIDGVLESGACLDLAHLAVTGTDLHALGYQGPVLGRALRRLLDAVLAHPECNKKEILLQLLQREDSL